jgi:hypothetical protein
VLVSRRLTPIDLRGRIANSVPPVLPKCFTLPDASTAVHTLQDCGGNALCRDQKGRHLRRQFLGTEAKG